MEPPSCFHILMASCGSKPITKIVKVRCCHLRKSKGAGWLAPHRSSLPLPKGSWCNKQIASKESQGPELWIGGALRSKKGEMNFFFFFCLNFPFLVSFLKCLYFILFKINTGVDNPVCYHISNPKINIT